MTNSNPVLTPEVATELLCRPVPMSGKERRNLYRIRCKPLFITVEVDGKKMEQRKLSNEEVQIKYSPLGVEHRLDYRLGQRKWVQLCKWLKRATNRRQLTQDAHQMLVRRQAKLGEKTGQPADNEVMELLEIAQQLNALSARAATLDIFIDAVESEMLRRQKLWESVAKAGAPKLADKLKTQIINN